MPINVNVDDKTPVTAYRDNKELAAKPRIHLKINDRDCDIAIIGKVLTEKPPVPNFLVRLLMWMGLKESYVIVDLPQDKYVKLNKNSFEKWTRIDKTDQEYVNALKGDRDVTNWVVAHGIPVGQPVPAAAPSAKSTYEEIKKTLKSLDGINLGGNVTEQEILDDKDLTEPEKKEFVNILKTKRITIVEWIRTELEKIKGSTVLDDNGSKPLTQHMIAYQGKSGAFSIQNPRAFLNDQDLQKLLPNYPLTTPRVSISILGDSVQLNGKKIDECSNQEKKAVLDILKAISNNDQPAVLSALNVLAPPPPQTAVSGITIGTGFIKLQKDDKEPLTFQNLQKSSVEFEKRFKIPTVNNKIAELVKKAPAKEAEVVDHAKRTSPTVDAKVMLEICDALEKRKQTTKGTKWESIYKEMTPQDYIVRLLTKRPIAFLNPDDDYMLRSGAKGRGAAYVDQQGRSLFQRIGTDTEGFTPTQLIATPKLAGEPYNDHFKEVTLENYLSYDEMVLSAKLQVIVPTHFINNGDQFNNAKPGPCEPKGYIVGAVGCRFEKPGLMEMQAPYFKAGNLDEAVYAERMRSAYEPILRNANAVGTKDKPAYVHLGGLGLGAWSGGMVDKLKQITTQVVAKILKENKFDNIGVVDFSWIQEDGVDGKKDQERINNIQIRLSHKDIAQRRRLADKLPGNYTLVAAYPWDGNAFPGNEYWFGATTASMDPGAASCSTIAELQNPEINKWMLNNLTITGGSKADKTALAQKLKLPDSPQVQQWIQAG